MSTESSEAPPELDWLALHNEFEALHKTESMTEKFQRKALENPFVPIGKL